MNPFAQATIVRGRKRMLRPGDTMTTRNVLTGVTGPKPAPTRPTDQEPGRRSAYPSIGHISPLTS
jgi:hypothetical protein